MEPTVKIRNKQTGEIKEIPVSQAGSFGVAPAGNNSPTPPSSSFLQGKTLPVGGGILGGLIGSLLGPVGGVGGAAAGYAGGDTIRKSLASLTHTPLNVPQQDVSQINPTINAGGIAGPGVGGILSALGIGNINLPHLNLPQSLNPAFSNIADTTSGATNATKEQAIGEGFARVLGLLAHPLAPVIGKVNQLVKDSPAMINLSDTLSQLMSQGKEKFAGGILNSEFPEAYNNVANSVMTKAGLNTPHIAAENSLVGGQVSPNILGDVVPNNVPVEVANDIKRKMYDSVSKYFGQVGPILPETGKLTGSILKNQIEEAVPGVGMYNKIASGMYALPNTLRDLSYALGGRGGSAVRNIAGIPVSLAQTLLPQGGGYLNQLLPALSQILPNLFNQ